MYRHLMTRDGNGARHNESEESEEILSKKEGREETKDDRRFEANSSNFATIPTARDQNKNFKRKVVKEDNKEINNMVNFYFCAI